ncbi:class I SAM-dependent methyltransferase [Paenibacillus agilis]|uniref:Class I SAM-dependent methyltransferase n=1 Tax=Paenibacillus agilis TaxID=3020863 RepID=A0A559J1W4_9BACL|nr:class I SAM-dependent methyltransferase [Paenibacillus agilis]TVX93885.1 class I SAM-dependent methyltransferase [Paenibacillus agilis]
MQRWKSDWTNDDSIYHFTGWDFSTLAKYGGMQEFPLPWNYAHIVMPRVRQADSLLDMGTGGGEFLSKCTPLPACTYATEGYAPNVEVARELLGPLGVKVVPFSDDEHIPLPSEHFQMIINRHDSFNASEVARMLKKGGTFVTQQAGGHNDLEFNDWLGAPYPDFIDWNLDTAVNNLKREGLTIEEAVEVEVKTRFYDIRTIIAYLQIVSGWQIPDFSVITYEKELRKLDERLVMERYVDTTCHRFLVIARKP